MAISHTIPENRFDQLTIGDFAQGIADRKDALVYFLCNVGDADTQVLLLPHHDQLGHRLAVVVDVYSNQKASAVIDWATDKKLLSPRHVPGGAPNGAGAEKDIALVVATHPHADHIDGLPAFLEKYSNRIDELWDPGYYHPIGSYHNMMAQIAANSQIAYANPSGGYRTWQGNTAITVLGPSIQLRNRYDSYGVLANDASITLQVETPVPRVITRDQEGNRVQSGSRNVVVLGGDAQTESWSHTLADFPRLRKSESPAAKAIGAAQGDHDPLNAGVHKVSHHGSKNGVNLELVERIGAKLTLVSSVRSGGGHGFPHEVTRHILREALKPLARSGGLHNPDDDPDLGLFYTGDNIATPAGAELPLGTIAVVLRAGKLEMWRLGDAPGAKLDLSDATTAWRWK
jgi:hypothetical protein